MFFTSLLCVGQSVHWKAQFLQAVPNSSCCQLLLNLFLLVLCSVFLLWHALRCVQIALYEHKSCVLYIYWCEFERNGRVLLCSKIIKDNFHSERYSPLQLTVVYDVCVCMCACMCVCAGMCVCVSRKVLVIDEFACKYIWFPPIYFCKQICLSCLQVWHWSFSA